jgi:hypothetical protein
MADGPKGSGTVVPQRMGDQLISVYYFIDNLDLWLEASTVLGISYWRSWMLLFLLMVNFTFIFMLKIEIFEEGSHL